MGDLVLERLKTFPRLPLAHLPTPVERLRRLEALFPDKPKLWMKRDDLTGLAQGGNKVRKLEFLIKAAVDEKATAVVTAGGPQSNHCRQTAAAAARLGLDCHLVLGGEESANIGNVLLDRLCGARLHWTPRAERESRMVEVADEIRSDGGSPIVIPVGG
ncbi:MAG: pyridoxal-phosphate dependent enzyme, partial [Verrucomicrobiota bacterium]